MREKGEKHKKPPSLVEKGANELVTLQTLRCSKTGNVCFLLDYDLLYLISLLYLITFFLT